MNADNRRSDDLPPINGSVLRAWLQVHPKLPVTLHRQGDQWWLSFGANLAVSARTRDELVAFIARQLDALDAEPET